MNKLENKIEKAIAASEIDLLNMKEYNNLLKQESSKDTEEFLLEIEEMISAYVDSPELNSKPGETQLSIKVSNTTDENQLKSKVLDNLLILEDLRNSQKVVYKMTLVVIVLMFLIDLILG